MKKKNRPIPSTIVVCSSRLSRVEEPLFVSCVDWLFPQASLIVFMHTERALRQQSYEWLVCLRCLSLCPIWAFSPFSHLYQHPQMPSDSFFLFNPEFLKKWPVKLMFLMSKPMRSHTIYPHNVSILTKSKERKTVKPRECFCCCGISDVSKKLVE